MDLNFNAHSGCRDVGLPINAYWVEADILLAGPYPRTTEDRERLLALNVGFILDLTESSEAPSYRGRLMDRVLHHRMAIPDFDVPSRTEMVRILDWIDLAIMRAQRASPREAVYVHCFAGLGRTGTVIGCYLVRHGLTGVEALRRICDLRRYTLFPDTPSSQTRDQRRMVRTWRES